MAHQDDCQEPDSTRRLDRRQFIGAAGVVGAGAALGRGSSPAPPETSAEPADKPGASEIPQRPLGRTGATVSALGLGGHHLGDLPTVEEASRLVHEAVDAGITFYDNCWEYWNGRAEDWLGRGLKGRRD